MESLTSWSRKARQLALRIFKSLDRRMERLVLFRPSGVGARLWVVVLVHLLFAAFLSRLHLGFLTFDLFVLPVLVSSVVFKLRGMWIVPLSGVLYALAGLVSHDVPTRWVGFNTVGQMAEWLVLSAFVLITLDRYAAVKRLQNRFTQDLELARRLQSSLIQPHYDFGSVRIQGFVRQSHDVGGDFYYFRPFLQKYVVFCLGDVMGKGIAASMLMAMIMGFMFEWGKKESSPSSVLKKLNNQLSRLGGGGTDTPFVTMFYAVYDEESRELTYTVAGHQAGLLVHGNGEVEPLSTEGIPVGLFEDTDFAEASVVLSPGDRVVLFTDGISEARDESGDMYGADRLKALLAMNPSLPIAELLGLIQRDVLRFASGKAADDMAVLIMEAKA